jgi:hypothetical protein
MNRYSGSWLNDMLSALITCGQALLRLKNTVNKSLVFVGYLVIIT